MPEPLDATRRIGLRHRDGEPTLWAVVDTADYELVNQHKWYPAENGFTVYAITSGDGRTLYMHRLILQVPDGLEVDHIDHNGLNNCRANLRLATRAENVRYRRGVDVYAGRRTTSRFKGVSRHTTTPAWTVRIQVNGRREHVGMFADEEEAARAYDRRAREVYGEFAYLNFPNEVAA